MIQFLNKNLNLNLLNDDLKLIIYSFINENYITNRINKIFYKN